MWSVFDGVDTEWATRSAQLVAALYGPVGTEASPALLDTNFKPPDLNTPEARAEARAALKRFREVQQERSDKAGKDTQACECVGTAKRMIAHHRTQVPAIGVSIHDAVYKSRVLHGMSEADFLGISHEELVRIREERLLNPRRPRPLVS